MNPGNAAVVLFSFLVVAAWALYMAARQASTNGRSFRLGAYSEMFVPFFAEAVFILIGLLG
jgi:hypothetical protein